MRKPGEVKGISYLLRAHNSSGAKLGLEPGYLTKSAISLERKEWGGWVSRKGEERLI